MKSTQTKSQQNLQPSNPQSDAHNSSSFVDIAHSGQIQLPLTHY